MFSGNSFPNSENGFFSFPFPAIFALLSLLGNYLSAQQSPLLPLAFAFSLSTFGANCISLSLPLSFKGVIDRNVFVRACVSNTA